MRLRAAWLLACAAANEDGLAAVLPSGAVAPVFARRHAEVRPALLEFDAEDGPTGLAGPSPGHAGHEHFNHSHHHPAGIPLDHTVDRVAFSMSFSVLFFAAVIVPFYYMTNSSDDDIRFYGWKVLYMTLCIFVAVWIFDTVHETHQYLNAHASHAQWGGIVEILIWYLIMQLTLRNCETEANAHTYGLVLAHITGFAAAHFCADLVKELSDEGHLGISVGVIFGVFVIFQALNYLTAKLRRSTTSKWDWHNVVEIGCQHAEDDVVGVCVSFISMMVVRKLITDTMPDSHGGEGHGDMAAVAHPLGDRVALLGASAAFLLVAILFGKFFYEMKANNHGHAPVADPEEPLKWLALRLESQCQFIVIFLAAWLFIFACQWYVQSLNNWVNDGMVVRVGTAGLCTFCSIILVYVFDFISDYTFRMDWRGVAAGISNVIGSFGIIIGFSWERAFNRAKEDVALRIGLFYSGRVDDLFGILKNEVAEAGSLCEGSCMNVALGCLVSGAVVVAGSFLPMLKWYVFPAMHHAEHRSREAHGLKKDSVFVAGSEGSEEHVPEPHGEQHEAGEHGAHGAEGYDGEAAEAVW